MYTDINLNYILLPAFLIAGIFIVVMRLRLNKQNLTVAGESVALLKIYIVAIGFIIFLLWFSLPSTASLKTFGYPEDISEIKNEKHLLNLLQSYNKAIVRTTEVLHWFIFIFIWWFLSTLYYVTKLFNNREK